MVRYLHHMIIIRVEIWRRYQIARQLLIIFIMRSVINEQVEFCLARRYSKHLSRWCRRWGHQSWGGERWILVLIGLWIFSAYPVVHILILKSTGHHLQRHIIQSIAVLYGPIKLTILDVVVVRWCEHGYGAFLLFKHVPVVVPVTALISRSLWCPCRYSRSIRIEILLIEWVLRLLLSDDIAEAECCTCCISIWELSAGERMLILSVLVAKLDGFVDLKLRQLKLAYWLLLLLLRLHRRLQSNSLLEDSVVAESRRLLVIDHATHVNTIARRPQISRFISFIT